MKRTLTAAERKRMEAELDAVYEETWDEACCAINKICIKWGQLDRCPGNPPCRTCPSR